jgi:predicted nuclease of predicted toxin-antitoxin system
LVDAQLPPALARWLCEQGHEAQHVEDVGLRNAEDGSIWEYALTVETVIVTKDEDFAERAARDSNSPVIVWLRIGNSTNHALLQWLWSRWPQVIMLLDNKHRLIEVR